MAKHWYDQIMADIEQQEEDLRLEEQQRAMVARPAPRSAPLGQSSPTPHQLPDPKYNDSLGRAERVVGALVAQSGSYPGLAWAAGVYELAGETRVYATSNEGMGYIPIGTRWDRSARLVFDPAVALQDTMTWQGLVNPARIVAGHFLRLSAPRPSMRLLAVASTAPLGVSVEDFLAKRGASVAERVAPGNTFAVGISRAEAVMPKVRGMTESLNWQQSWNAALALTLDAAALADLPRAYPHLYDVALAVKAGHADWQRISYIENWSRSLIEEAQSRRVAEDRLGPVSTKLQDESTVLPQGGVFAYATPFYAARVCAMLSAMMRARVADEPLSSEVLADLAYEHYSVSENADATRNILSRGGSSERRY